MTGSIRDWQKLFAQAVDNLQPGGWMEVQEYEIEISSDDGSHLKAENFVLWKDKLNEASQMFGKPFSDYSLHKQRMEEAGFIDISEDTFKVCPFPSRHYALSHFVAN